MANYLKSGPCANCGSSDARAEYDDGSSFCFACPPGQGYIPGHIFERLKPRKSGEKAVKVIDTSEWQYSLPQKALDWLGKYEITDLEMSSYGLRWNPKLTNKQWDGETGALAMPVFDNGKVVCVSYRLFDADKTKSITIGYRPYTVLKGEPQDSVVIVEDYVSAMKVSRVLPAIPLLGSSLPDDALLRLSKSHKSVYLWLDEDKLVDSMKIAKKAELLGLKARPIFTWKDPKEFTSTEIQEILK